MAESIYNLNEIYGNSEDALLDKSFRRKIFFTVTLAHVIFVIGPFVFFALWSKMYDKKPIAMQISIANLPTAGKINEPPGPLPDTPKNDNKEEKKAEKNEPPSKEVEDESTVEEPPAKIEKKAPVEKVVEKPVKKETVKVPVEKKVPVVKTKEKKVETPKKWEPKKPTEIVKATKIVKGKSTTPKINSSDLAARLKKIQNQCKVTDTATGGGGGTGVAGPPGGIGSPNGTSTVPASYYETVSVYLYDLWKQPGKSELKGLKPTVTVHVSIDASGNIKSGRIVKKSNNLPMDSSVEELLSKLKKLPPPPQGALELDITLEIDDNP